MQELETISGTIERFLFQSTDNGFSVFVLQASANTTITVKGYIANAQAGQEVQLKGVWVFHTKFGKQFEASHCTSMLPTTVVGLKKYLGSGLIKGIGPSYADKLVNYFGADILKVIDNTPERLQEVGGIGHKRIDKIIAAWKDQKEIADIMVFLQDKNISIAFATKIYKQYKQESLAVLHENPYRLADEIWGIGFKTADEIAQKLGFQLHAPARIAAGIIFTISSTTQQGSLYIELKDLKTKVIALLGLNEDEHESLVKQALHVLYEKDKIKLITFESLHYITLTSYYFCEKAIAKRIETLLDQPSKFSFALDMIYAELRVALPGEIQLNEDQQRGIISCLQNKISIITGGPGTGKTTLIKKLLTILENNKITYKLAAPTGRASKRIIEGTGRYATTIHRLLEFDVATMGFTHNETNALKLNFLIIDEASMIDVFLAHAILKALPQDAHLILIGDIDQLPSVGPGNILLDLISSKKVSCVYLTQIFRQAQDSLIVVNAHRINKGEFPVSHAPNARHDFLFIKEEEPESIMTHLKQILSIELHKKGISLDDTMILTPMNRGIVGTQSLNYMLQNLLNPQVTYEQISHAGTVFKRGDKVMQIRNNYDKQVYNGDIGTIESIDLEDKQLMINYGEHMVGYEFDELNELVLAYAISIHKSQGSEYGAVIIPIFMQHFMLLQRNLIYTALTRAKKLCIIIGQTKAVAIAFRNSKKTERLTFLKQFLLSHEL
jgi:exodeoxyribonuclease V alpha subunit